MARGVEGVSPRFSACRRSTPTRPMPHRPLYGKHFGGQYAKLTGWERRPSPDGRSAFPLVHPQAAYGSPRRQRESRSGWATCSGPEERRP